MLCSVGRDDNFKLPETSASARRLRGYPRREQDKHPKIG
jgi:hypothetical protein